MIPMHETPIYAQLKAERRRERYAPDSRIQMDGTIRMMYVPAEVKPLVEDEYGTAWVKVMPNMSKFRERKPLAKKGRRK